MSETNREFRRDAGGIRRLTVAVLVDGIRGADGTFQSRSEAELADLRDLVSSAVGYDETRGDIITIKSMELQTAEALLGQEPGGIWQMLDLMSLIQLAVLALVSLALGFFVIRPIFLSGRNTSGAAPLALPPGEASAARQVEVLTGEIDDDGVVTARALDANAAGTARAAEPDPVERLRKLIAERQTESVEILRNWIEEAEETRG